MATQSLSPEQAAYALGWSPSTMYTYISRGKVKPEKLPNGRLQITAQSLVDAIPLGEIERLFGSPVALAYSRHSKSGRTFGQWNAALLVHQAHEDLGQEKGMEFGSDNSETDFALAQEAFLKSLREPGAESRDSDFLWELLPARVKAALDVLTGN